jgi:ATP-dependent DNA helicase RecQ
MLLDYFGEKESTDCGCCDVCLAKNSSGLSNHEFNTIKNAIEKAANASPQEVNKLVESLPHPMEKSITVIRFLADNDPQYQLFDGYLRIIGPKE